MGHPSPQSNRPTDRPRYSVCNDMPHQCRIYGDNYLCQGGYVIVIVCLSVCPLATLRKNFRTDLHEIFREGWQWTKEQMIKCWWRSRSRIRIQIQIRIATPVRRALAEVCTVPVLLVTACFYRLDALPVAQPTASKHWRVLKALTLGLSN